jgi:trk system potassium uptake protein TrkH
MLLTPIPISLLYHHEGSLQDGALFSFLISSVITLTTGLALHSFVRGEGDVTHREGFGIVTFGWIGFAIFGSLPYIFSATIPNPVDAFFESMSGFTTTGSTVITNLDIVPRSILFWRSMTQWLGGMGIIVLSLAILPFLGIGGMQLFTAEVPGPTTDRLSPRIQETAKVLWVIYFFITFSETTLLLLGGMSFFDAICHSFTTMATGGFSTSNQSIGDPRFGSFIHVVITCFMFMAGVNFSLYFKFLRGNLGSAWKSEEFRFYVGLIVCATAAVFFMNWNLDGSPLIRLRDSAFQVVSLLTTTGYATADYELWPAVSQYILITLMFMGGCAGSTGGSMKIVRWRLIIKHAYMQIYYLIHPREVRILKLDLRPVSNVVIQSILGFFALYLGIFLVGSILMSLIIPAAEDGTSDIVTAGASVIACLGNIGPGLGNVGPTDNFAAIPAIGKIILSICMLVGRLELFTVLVLFMPSFWRK